MYFKRSPLRGVMSSSGGVFSSEVDSTRNVLKFSKVEELSGKEIVWVSGKCGHFLAVSKEGRVFGCGSNNDGKLGLGEYLFGLYLTITAPINSDFPKIIFVIFFYFP